MYRDGVEKHLLLLLTTLIHSRKFDGFLICCEQTLCLLATRCVAKTFVLVFVIVGIAAPQVTVSSGSNDTAFFLTKITSKTGGVSVEMSISDYFSLFSCDAGTAMCNASLAMGIIAILCAAAGIGLSVATKFLPFNIPKLVILAVAAAESVTALIGFAIAACSTVAPAMRSKSATSPMQSTAVGLPYSSLVGSRHLLMLQ